MRNQEIAIIFNEMADLLEIKGDNPFRIRAYRRAGQNIDGLPNDVAGLSRDDLLKIPGIGRDLAEKIGEYLHAGKIAAYESLKKEVPPGIADILSVPGLGPKTAQLLYKKLRISSIDELEQHARAHQLSSLPGIREKTEANILRGIALVRRRTERLPLGRVMPIATEIIGHLRDHAPAKRIEAAGSLRRWKDTVRDIDILAVSARPADVMKTFVHLPQSREVLMHGPAKSSIITHEGVQVDLRVVKESSYGAALAYFTGSKEHNIRLREMAARKGLKINEYGIFREKDNRRLGGKDEEDVYRALGLPYIPPELREDTGEIEAALDNALPKLLDAADIRGDLHVHTLESDGHHTLEEIIAAGRERGYAYIAITDHARGLGVARGLDEERVMAQKRQIDALNRKNRDFRLLSGIELNIRSDGSVDFEDELLRTFDMVVASVHSGFRQTGEKMTQRIITAMKNPYISILAHPTGRLIGERDAYDADMEAVIDAAAETGTALEINAYPLRLDLNDLHAKRAKEKHVPVVISTDTHTISQLDYMNFGIAVARRGWLTRDDVMNTRESRDIPGLLRAKASRVKRLQPSR